MADTRAPSEPSAAWLLLILPIAAVVLHTGWGLMWFQCDDAYIAFRYIGNHQLGWGFTWNPPPFRPVEGYTSFLWVVLLDAVWTWTGVDPTRAANPLGLAFAMGSVLTITAMTWRLPWSDAWRPYKPLLVALVLAATLLNRTFLTWTTSGLETPLFVFLLLGWAQVALTAPRGRAWPAALSTMAMLLALTRPDGLLFAVATVAIVFADRRRLDASTLASFAPMGLIGVHVLWRRLTYGFWLPNTYYAKDVGWWPSSGVTYLLLFIVEYTWWLWVPVGLFALRRRWRDVTSMRSWHGHAATLLATAALLAHVAYYVLRVGGDHFEFRVFAHLPPLMAVLLLVWLDQAKVPPRLALMVAHAIVLLTFPVGWLDWHATREVQAESKIKKLRVKIAHRVPLPLQPYVWLHDNLQGWLVYHSVGAPHQTHKWFAIYKERSMPERDEAFEVFPPSIWSDTAGPEPILPISAMTSVGVIGWRLATVPVIDRLGLDDVVVARTEPHAGQMWKMAHTRRPPEGYVPCLEPNMDSLRRLTLRDRTEPMTAARIRACEALWWDRALEGGLVSPGPEPSEGTDDDKDEGEEPAEAEPAQATPAIEAAPHAVPAEDAPVDETP